MITKEERKALDRVSSTGEFQLDPLPSERDRAFELLASHFIRADAQGRTDLQRACDVEVYNMLLHFAHRMASLAVRERSTRRLQTALEAIALAGEAVGSDWRDTGQATLPLTDAAGRLGPISDRVFDEVARMAGGRVGAMIANAKAKHGIIGLFHRLAFRLFTPSYAMPTMTPDGFRYGKPVSMASRNQFGA
jgi:hypothetical protein